MTRRRSRTSTPSACSVSGADELLLGKPRNKRRELSGGHQTLRMSTMVMEFNTVPIEHPARPLLSGCSGSLTSCAALNGYTKSNLLSADRTFDGRYAELITFDKRDKT